MTSKMSVEEQLKDNIRDGWELMLVEKLHLAEQSFGHYKAVFKNKNLALIVKYYLTLTEKGWVNDLFKLPNRLKEAERGKCEEFAEAL